jgi:bifunctional DNA-binding transcriptional regulator/antitoxin component of YhaV-PrlF toxin-antitoxin module
MLTKIKEYRVGARGKRGLLIAVPSKWARAAGVSVHDIMELFANEEGQLVIQKK